MDIQKALSVTTVVINSVSMKQPPQDMKFA